MARSSRPGRVSAGSRTSERLVAASTTMRVSEAKPSISLSSAIRVFSRSDSPPWLGPLLRVRPTASISSMKMIAPPSFLARSKRSRARLAPTPANVSTKSDPARAKNGRWASPATARASSVLPVPGGPTRRAPRGAFAPRAVNRSGALRSSTSSREVVDGLVAPGHVGEAVLGNLADLLTALAGELADAAGQHPRPGEPDQQHHDHDEREQGQCDRGRAPTAGSGGVAVTGTSWSRSSSVNVPAYAYG